jgi:hypothetical protein
MPNRQANAGLKIPIARKKKEMPSEDMRLQLPEFEQAGRAEAATCAYNRNGVRRSWRETFAKRARLIIYWGS